MSLIVAVATFLLLGFMLLIQMRMRANVPSNDASATESHLRSAADLLALNTTLSNLQSELKSLASSQSQMHSAHREMVTKSMSIVGKMKSKSGLGSESGGGRDAAHVGGVVTRLERSTDRPISRNSQVPGTHASAASPSKALSTPKDPARLGGNIIAKGDSVKESVSSPYKQMNARKKAVIFTMDSITAYEESSRIGGAAGEILIRKSLEGAFQHFGVDFRVIRSDAEFEGIRGADYDIILVDPWTWAARGWVPKPPLRGQDAKVYILDFFGSAKLRGKGLNIPPERFLTAFGSKYNTFLGYYVEGAEDSLAEALKVTKLQQGVVWGKDPRHFEGRTKMLETALQSIPEVTFLSTSTQRVFQHPRMLWKGHQTPASWRNLLQESKFLIGLGDPLLGPSAIDAIAAGCVYINPTYGKPKKDRMNQHPYAAESIGSPYVCNYRLGDSASLQQCVKQALEADLKPRSLPDFEKDAHFDRVASIFNL